MTTATAAAILNISPAAVRAAIYRKHLNATRILYGDRFGWQVSQKAVEAYRAEYARKVKG